MTHPENENGTPEETPVDAAPTSAGDTSAESAPDDDLFLDDSDAPEAIEGAPADPIAGELVRVLAERDAVTRERDDLRDQLLRRAADLENMRRRHAKEKDEHQKFAAEKVLRDTVSVLDDLDRALEHAASNTDSAAVNSLVQGLQMVHRRFVQTMEKHGVVAVSALGRPFDPHMHEAISQREDTSVARNTVVQEFQKGYLLHDRLLRPAMVVVAVGGPAAEVTPADESADA
jgi:molecular chaperone GrpE